MSLGSTHATPNKPAQRRWLCSGRPHWGLWLCSRAWRCATQGAVARNTPVSGTQSHPETTQQTGGRTAQLTVHVPRPSRTSPGEHQSGVSPPQPHPICPRPARQMQKGLGLGLSSSGGWNKEQFPLCVCREQAPALPGLYPATRGQGWSPAACSTCGGGHRPEGRLGPAQPRTPGRFQASGAPWDVLTPGPGCTSQQLQPPRSPTTRPTSSPDQLPKQPATPSRHPSPPPYTPAPTPHPPGAYSLCPPGPGGQAGGH